MPIKLKSILKESRIRLREDETTDTLKTTLTTSSYETFVTQLGDAVKDSKVKAVLAAGEEDGVPADEKITLTDGDIDVTALRPTQNEIALDKSLTYPLTDVKSADSCLKGGTVAIAGKRIITAEGSYIVDGHHRWSQLYAMNKDAKIAVTDMVSRDLKNPLDFLKITQVAIAADLGKVPTQTAKGSINLITISEDQLKKFVIDTIKDPVLDVFKKYNKATTKEEAADYIWTNVQSMQKTSKPVAGAPKRDFMPQTDDAKNWEKLAAAGSLNYKEPFTTSESINKTRWRQIANIKKK
jgi:hypothetical protein